MTAEHPEQPASTTDGDVGLFLTVGDHLDIAREQHDGEWCQYLARELIAECDDADARYHIRQAASLEQAQEVVGDE